MKRILILLLALAAAAGWGGALADEGENLVRNGDFSQLDGMGLPQDWTRAMWFTDAGVSRLFAAEDGVTGGCAAVINADANDARFSQTISVEPDSYYRFSAMVRADGCGEAGYGATLSFEDTFVYSTQLFDTAGEWRYLEVCGKTGPDQTEVTLLLRLGGYSNVNTGAAYFDDVSCVRLDEAPEGVELHSLARYDAQAADVAQADAAEPAEPARNTQAFLLLAALYALLILALTRRSRRLLHGRWEPRLALAVGLALALALRLLVAVRVRGYNSDINCFAAWSERIYESGLRGFYQDGSFCDYPPGYMLLLWPVAALRTLFQLEYLGGAHLALIKFIPILCDLLGAGLIWKFAERRQADRRLAAALALLYAFNPAVLIDSAAWGQIDSVFTLLVALCAIKAADERYIPALIAFAGAMLIKPQAMLFAPLGLIAIAANLIRRPDRKKLRDALIGLGAALALIYLAGLIFCGDGVTVAGNALTRPIHFLIQRYGDTLGSYDYLVLNALNLYELFGFNWKPTGAQPFWTAFAWVMFALSYLYAGYLYLRSKDRRRLALCGALLITLIYCFGPMIHERYIYPALILLALAYVQDRDRRLLLALTVMSATAALNEILVLQGGMTDVNMGHLQASEQWLNAPLSLINVLSALYLCWVALDICQFARVRPLSCAADDAPGLPANPAGAPEICAQPRDHRLRLKRRECLFVLAITALYAVAAFTNLGTTRAPQTSWVSSQSGEAVVFDLQKAQSFQMIYYGGICNSTFTVELSNDGEVWTQPYCAQYNDGEVFRWIYYVPMDESLTVLYEGSVPTTDGSAYVTFATPEMRYPTQTARYVRISARSAGLKLSEIGFWGADERLIDARIVGRTGALEGFETDPALLLDEQDCVARAPSYLNGSYFDEIYHARTAYELLHGESIYEWTHPPLGKVLMMVGVQLFGMTPFGWRFMGALIGVLMLPLMYLLSKQLTKSDKLSAVAMLLLALDSMHFTQTRIATIDSYSVFWIMLMYLFMFRYFQMDWSKLSLRRTLIPLGLCGVTMGIAWATKWIGIYASAGLAVLFFWKLIRELALGGLARREKTRRALWTLAFCLLFFVLIPLLIYLLSYFWQLRCEGVTRIWDMLTTRRIKRVVELQKAMLSYHSGLGGDTHYFRTPWYQWPVIWWPMWYYSGTAYMPEGVISSISCMGNPAVWWTGLVSLLGLLGAAAWRRRAPKRWLMVLIGFASQFLPWVLVPRSTFIYHYFASVPFIILCTVLVLDEIRGRSPKAFRWTAGALLAAALVLFAAFYPLESGLPVSRDYAMWLRWFKWYNF